jgi:hypothetical protein
MRVTLEELRASAEKLFAHLEVRGYTDLEVDEDYYWEIEEAQRYDPSKEPSGFSMGQLSDDMSEVRRILGGEAPPVARGLVWLAAVLRRVGEQAIG